MKIMKSTKQENILSLKKRFLRGMTLPSTHLIRRHYSFIFVNTAAAAYRRGKKEI